MQRAPGLLDEGKRGLVELCMKGNDEAFGALMLKEAVRLCGQPLVQRSKDAKRLCGLGFGLRLLGYDGLDALDGQDDGQDEQGDGKC